MTVSEGIAFLKTAAIPQQIVSPASPQIVSLENGELSNTFLLAVISGSILLLYSLSRIIALHRRVKDLEARPPVDDIVMRGLIRSQLNDLVNTSKNDAKEKSSSSSLIDESEEDEEEDKSADEKDVKFSDFRDAKLKLEKKTIGRARQVELKEVEKMQEQPIPELQLPKLPPPIVRKKIESLVDEEEQEGSEASPQKIKKSKNVSKTENKNAAGKKRRSDQLSPVKLDADDK
jgi:hypothetical protein